MKVKGSLAFGYVALDAVVQHSLQLINSGLNTATYRVDVEAGLPLQVTPTDGKLTPTGSPESVCTLKLELTAEIAGPMSGRTQVSSILKNLLWHLSWSPVVASPLCTLLWKYLSCTLLLATSIHAQMTATSLTPGGENEAEAGGDATAQPMLPDAGCY